MATLPGQTRTREPLPALIPPYPDLLTSLEAARYLRFSSVLAFKKWARRRQITPERRGPKIALWPLVTLNQAGRRIESSAPEPGPTPVPQEEPCPEE